MANKLSSFLLLLVLAMAHGFHAIHPLPHQAKHASPRALVQQQGQSLSRSSSAVGPQQRASLMRREVVMIIPQVLFVAACAGGTSGGGGGRRRRRACFNP